MSWTDKKSQKETSHSSEVQTHDELEPLSPADAVEDYLETRKRELRKSSLSTHRSSLGFFKRFCQKEGINDLNELTRRILHRYRIWRREEASDRVDSLSLRAEQTQQDILRQFIQHCERINAVPPGLHKWVESPKISTGEHAREVKLEAERAETIRSHLRQYEYATVEHVVLELFFDTAARTGAIHGIDVDDNNLEADPPHIKLRHRPETKTPLKNGSEGERKVAISPDVVEILGDYAEVNRPDVEDKYGRKPLLTAGDGRLSKSTIRKYVYAWTRPCVVGEECPDGRDPEECEARNTNSASKCPYSKSPHAIRRGVITHQLNNDVAEVVVGDRCDVSVEVLREHYDGRDEQERMEARRRAIREARDDDEKYGGDGVSDGGLGGDR